MNQDTGTYSQFNFEGITLYKNNIWVLSNVVTTDNKEADCIGNVPGITFKKWDENADEEGNGYFSFNGSTQTGALLPDHTVGDGECKNVESMAIDENGRAYCLKCDTKSKYAVLLTTDKPEVDTEKAAKKMTYQDDKCLYHCNGMTYNPIDKRLYVCGYEIGNSKSAQRAIFPINKNGEAEDPYDSKKPQYGIAFYRSEADKYEFLLMNKKPYSDKIGTDNTIPFDVATLENGHMELDQDRFRLEFGRKAGEDLQDIFYHSDYGMLFPVTFLDEAKQKFTIIYHVSKEQIASAMKNTKKSSIVRPDFAIVLDKRSKYNIYEIESMDIAPDTKRMVMCGNFEIPTSKTQKDSFETLKTLTFE